jgi:hypothetical protein
LGDGALARSRKCKDLDFVVLILLLILSWAMDGANSFLGDGATSKQQNNSKD